MRPDDGVLETPPPYLPSVRWTGLLPRANVCAVRVLLVTHRFLPEHAAGTELYTARLARELTRRGHAVTVLTAVKDVARAHLSTGRRSFEGLVVHEIVNNLLDEDFRSTWQHLGVDQAFDAVLDEVRPELVHVQHLMYLSAGVPERARARGIPVVMTLHDFWLQCARFGQRVHADGELCARIDLARCGTCLARLEHAQPAAARAVAPWLARFRALTGVDVGPSARALLAWLRRAPADDGPVPTERAAQYEQAANERNTALRTRLGRAVARFVAPSRFLAGELVAAGLPAERMSVLPTGIDLAGRSVRIRGPRERVRVLFLGSRVRLKGPHVLLEAWKRLPYALREGADLFVAGPAGHEPAYQRELETLAREVGARLTGPVAPERVAAELAGADLVVVPSLWFENRPLVVLEAMAARVPLLVSDLGGLAELVEEGVHGWRFAAGDVDALRERLEAVLHEPAALDALYPEGREADVPSFEEHVGALLELYAEVAPAKG